jgi:hypothetical protein
LEDEGKEVPPYLLVTVRDEDGDIVRTMTKKPSKGIQRFNWDLRYDNPNIKDKTKFDPFAKDNGGIYVMPGKYLVEILMVHNGKETLLGERKEFTVKSVTDAVLPSDRAEIVSFQREVSRLSKAMNGTLKLTQDLMKEVNMMQQTALTLPGAHGKLMPELVKVKKELEDILFVFNGVKPKASWEEVPPAAMPLMRRLNTVIYTQINSTSNITSTSKEGFEILKEEFPPVLQKVKDIATKDMVELRKMMDEMNAPYTPCRIPDWK